MSTLRINNKQWLPLLLLAFSPFAQATADYPCTTGLDCPAYAHAPTASEPTEVSANMNCVADPLQPDYGFCGYVDAECKVAADCDFGRCENGKCAGYLGAPCSNTMACLGFLTCGTDGLCGGLGAQCPNDDVDCFSSTCISTMVTDPNGTQRLNKVCRAAPAQGMWAKAGCSSDSNCASGICTNHICAETALKPSARARHRFKRALANTHEKIAKAMANAFSNGRTSTLGCPVGLTACLTGVGSGSHLGYECVDTQSTLESCGGCLPTTGVTEADAIGIDCTALPNVEEVSCRSGQCVIQSCTAGKMVDPDGQGCI